jgi:hypothetical protein
MAYTVSAQSGSVTATPDVPVVESEQGFAADPIHGIES